MKTKPPLSFSQSVLTTDNDSEGTDSDNDMMKESQPQPQHATAQYVAKETLQKKTKNITQKLLTAFDT
jgi:hypothetical protein